MTDDPNTPRDAPADAPRSGFTLDLSSGAAARAKRPKGFVPVVQKTINLTTRKAAPEADAAPVRDVPQCPEPARAPRADAGPARPVRNESLRTGPTQEARGERRPSGGTSLADLLDEATLARLRGR